jgi:two-component sensor histidine kinase
LKEALKAARTRLHVLAQVHELLYRGNTGDREILMSSLLEDVADALRKSFDEQSEKIVLTVVSEPISLSPDRAIPLALLANELLTNAYKHAFPEAAPGTIALQLSCNPQHELVLQIVDNGVGMPQREDDATTLGLRLIRIFAKQLNGELAFAAAAGTKGTRITFTAPLLLNGTISELSGAPSVD